MRTHLLQRPHEALKRTLGGGLHEKQVRQRPVKLGPVWGVELVLEKGEVGPAVVLQHVADGRQLEQEPSAAVAGGQVAEQRQRLPDDRGARPPHPRQGWPPWAST